MKVWSKGLGNIELEFDLEKYYVEREKKDGVEFVYIKGVITDPVYWDFRITMTRDDIAGILKIATSWDIIAMFIKNIRLSLVSFFKYVFVSKRKKVDDEEKKEVKK